MDLKALVITAKKWYIPPPISSEINVNTDISFEDTANQS